MFEFMTLPRRQMTRRMRLKRYSYSLAPALVLASVWGTLVEPDTLTTPHTDLTLGQTQPPDTIRIAGTGAGQIKQAAFTHDTDTLRVAVITDLHVGSSFIDLDKVREVVAATNSQSPDLILLLGDYLITGVVAGNYTRPEKFAPIMGELEAPLGVWAVLGNHDHWEDPEGVMRAFTKAGIRMLENATVELNKGRHAFTLAGVGTYGEGKSDMALVNRLSDESLPTLLFTHNPELFEHLPQSVDFAIGGHTHGLQVSAPHLGWPFTPDPNEARYGRGVEMVGNIPTFVSPGVGTSAIPFRFGRKPEISILNLRFEQNGRISA